MCEIGLAAISSIFMIFIDFHEISCDFMRFHSQATPGTAGNTRDLGIYLDPRAKSWPTGYRLLAVGLRYPGLGNLTLTPSKILAGRLLAAGLRYPGLGTLTPEQNSGRQAIGRWA